MKAIKYLFILGATMFLGAACQRESAPVKMPTVRFEVAAPEAVKALGDGTLATKLFVRVYDANGTFIREETPAPLPAGGWKAELQLVEGTYSFSFWATSPDATAFQTNGSTLTVDYSKMHPGTDKEDAFWGAVNDLVVGSAGVTQPVVLTRPFAQLNLDFPVKSFSLTAPSLPQQMDLLSGETSGNAGALNFTVGETPANTTAYILVPSAGITASLGFSTGDATGTASNVPLGRNKRTTIQDN